MDSIGLLVALLVLGLAIFFSDARFSHPLYVAFWVLLSIGIWHAVSSPDVYGPCAAAEGHVDCPLRIAMQSYNATIVLEAMARIDDRLRMITADSNGLGDDLRADIDAGHMSQTKADSLAMVHMSRMLGMACSALVAARRYEQCLVGTEHATNHTSMGMRAMVAKLKSNVREYDKTLRARTLVQFYQDERPSMLQVVQFVWKRVFGNEQIGDR